MNRTVKEWWRSIPFGFVLVAMVLVLMVLAISVVYLRIQQSNHDLGEKLRACEFELRNIQETNSILAKELGIHKMPENVLKRAEAMGLGLSPVVVTQIVRIPEVEIPALGDENEGGR